MDAAGLGVLVRAQRHTRRLGADLVGCNARGIVRRVFDLTGLAVASASRECRSLSG